MEFSALAQNAIERGNSLDLVEMKVRAVIEQSENARLIGHPGEKTAQVADLWIAS